jgi:hypothetical protein
MESLTNGLILPNSRPPVMSVRRSGRAIVGFRESEWIEAGAFRDGDWVNGPFTNTWSGVATDLATNAALLAEVRRAMGAPVLNNQLEFSNPLKPTLLLHLGRPKRAALWFGPSAQLMLRDGRLPEARKELLTEISLLRFLADDQVAISELVRIAIAGIARTYTWEALQAHGWNDPDLAAIQTAWDQQTFSSNMVHALEGELVFISTSIKQMREANEETYQLLFGAYASLINDDEAASNGWVKRIKTCPGGEAVLHFWRRQIYCRLWRFAWSHQAEIRTMRNVTELIGLARSAASNGSYATIEADLASLIGKASDKGVYDRLRFPPPESILPLSRTILKASRAETDRAMTLCAIALKRYHLRHGKYPDTLKLLVPEFLPAMPRDFIDGQPLKYRRDGDDNFILYSVGENGRDDDGDVSLPPGLQSSDLWRRRDYVWPAPATLEEVEEYRREANKN